MIRKKVRKTTKSNKRFTYKSFKESLDSTSIVNTTSTLSLSNNARLKHGEDIEDTSFHYNEAINHWKEVNISKNFTSYCAETHSYSNTLPQLLYHKKFVFQKLKEYIDQHDNVSAEPLLDLLVNFVHDLGAEDFMEFYEDAMKSLVDLALHASSTNDNDTQTNKLMTNDNVIQWVFTTVAFTFKYMSKSLSNKDGLLLTLNLFYPCLILTKTQYILRFSAEAVSFLFKKANEKSVFAGVCFLKDKLIQENTLKEGEEIALKNSLVIILSESCKNISNTFHSRTLNIVLNSVFEQSILPSQEVNMEMILILCDTLLSLVNYGTIESDKEIYEISLNYISKNLSYDSIENEDYLVCVFQVLSSLAFAGSGRNNNSWDLFADITEKILSHTNIDNFASRFDEIIAYYFAVIMRNAPMNFLSRFHTKIFNTMQKLKGGQWFLSFVQSCLRILKEKTMIFGSKIISDYIIKNWESHEKQISCFLATTNQEIIADNRSLSGGNKLNIIITKDFYNNIIDGLNEIFENGTNTEESLLAIYWRLLILNFGKNFDNYEVLVKLFLKFFNFNQENELSLLSVEISGNILSALAKQDLPDSKCAEILGRIIKLISYSKFSQTIDFDNKERTAYCFMEDNKVIKSQVFVDGFLKFLSSIESKNDLTLSKLKNSHTYLLDYLSNGLLYSSHELRTSIVECLSILYVKSGLEVPPVVNLIQSIESTQLDLRNSRDLALKIRSLAKLFDSDENNGTDDVVVCATSGKIQYLGIAVKWIFGMLSNKFKPVWDVIFEVINKIISKEESLVWELIYFFLYRVYKLELNDEELFNGITENLGFESAQFLLLDSRINDSFKYFDSVFYNYFNLDSCFINLANKAKTTELLSDFMRYQSLRILLTAPGLGEKKARFLVPVILSQKEDDTYMSADDTDDDDEVLKTEPYEFEDWNTREKNMLIELFGKFKNIKNIYKSSEIYDVGSELLCSKNVPTQKAALKVILAFKNPQVKKFSENLDNIVNSNTFKDEVITFFSSNEAESLDEVIEIILRILYGKSKVKITTNSKKTQKNSILKLLNSLSESQVTRFLQLGYSNINYELLINKYSKTKAISDSLFREINISQRLLRKLLGFVNLLSDSINEFKNKFPHALESTIDPLIFSIGVSQFYIDNFADIENEPIFTKIAKHVRQIGLRDLSRLFSLLLRNELEKREETSDMQISFSWSNYYLLIYDLIIRNRLDKFSVENLQAPSSLMLIIISWARSPELVNMLYFEEFRPVRSILDLFENPNCKNSVLYEILTFVSNIILLEHDTIIDDKLEFSQKMIVESCFKTFPNILARADVSKEVISSAVNIILSFIERQLISPEDTIVVKTLLDTLMNALDRLTPEKSRHTIAKSASNIELKTKMLIAVGKILPDLRISNGFSDVEHIYVMVSKFFICYSDSEFRNAAVNVMLSIGGLIQEFSEIGKLIADLNSFSSGRIGEIDFERRIDAFTCLSEEKYDQLTSIQWLPFLYNFLFFIEDEELGIRTNARHALSRFVDGMSKKYKDANEAKPAIKLLKDVVLESLRFGLRHKDEKVEKEYVSLLSHIIEHSKYYTDLSDMKILFFNNDEEANFFSNINHIQIHRRQRAVNRLPRFAPHISPSNISRYLIPIVERFVYTGKTENLRQLANDAIETVGILTRYVTWNQYKALMRRYVSFLNSQLEYFHDMVRLVIACSKALLISAKNSNKVSDDEDEKMNEKIDYKQQNEDPTTNNQWSKKIDHDKVTIKEFTKKQEEIDYFIVEELNPKLENLLLTRDEETASVRITISEAMVALILCLSKESKEIQLPSVLTKISQTLRSKSEELRDAVRKSLGKIVNMLGTRYFRFVIKELKSALKRGPQLHILSFTVHYLLVLLNGVITVGGLNDCSDLIMDIIMEDLFGAASKEKEAEGYSSKTKEVKHNKSFDTAEILATYISLDEFNTLLKPVKLLLSESINLKTQNKLDELLKRIAMGFNHNPGSSSLTSLVLCYEIFVDSKEFLQTTKLAIKSDLPSEQEEHFLVQLDAKPMKTEMEFSKYFDSLRKFSMEMLRNILSRNEDLVTFSNLSGFIPLLEQSLRSENDGLIIACLKVLNYIILLPLDEEATKRLNVATRRVLRIFRNTPSTNSDISQACLRFLAAVVRHKNEDIDLKDLAVSYILVRLLPDLENPNRQGLAFNFLKAVLSKHIMLADIYDIMEKVSKILVTSHTREVRSMARSSYFQFIMEYDQGKGKLEKEFKAMIGNLSYPSEAGRLSVLELIKSIIIKSTHDLLLKISTSFFVALSNVAVTDDSLKCRESASEILKLLMSNLSTFSERGKSENLTSAIEHIDFFLISWIKQRLNGMLIRCGFQIYKIYLESFGLNHFSELNQLFMTKLMEIFKAASDGDSIFDEEDEDFDEQRKQEWELVYSGLNCFSQIVLVEKESIFGSKKMRYEEYWRHIVALLLYPHSWVRSSSCRLMGILLSNLDKAKFLSDLDLQTVAYKLIRQLAAPRITMELGNQVVKNLIFVTMRWEKNGVKYIDNKKNEKDDDDEAVEENSAETKSFDTPIEWLVYKLGAIMRNDYRSQEFVNSKKCAIKLCAMVIQIMDESRLLESKISESIILSLYNFTENDVEEDDTQDKKEMYELSSECLKLLENKIGVSDYSKVFAKVRSIVVERRVERRTKRAQMKVSHPEVASKRKMKKHAKIREKRKAGKDENGMYHGRKKPRR